MTRVAQDHNLTLCMSRKCLKFPQESRESTVDIYNKDHQKAKFLELDHAVHLYQFAQYSTGTLISGLMIM